MDFERVSSVHVVAAFVLTCKFAASSPERCFLLADASFEARQTLFGTRSGSQLLLEVSNLQGLLFQLGPEHVRLLLGPSNVHFARSEFLPQVILLVLYHSVI